MSSLTSTSVRPLTILTENDGVPGSYFEREPDNYTVGQLKRWLKCRGLKQNGKRDDLLKRVSDCIFSNSHKVLDVSIDDGKWFAQKVLKESKEILNIKDDRVQYQAVIPVIPTSGWCVFQSKDIPSLFNYGHIYHYALESVKTIVKDPIQSDDENEHGLGHMTDKPLKNGRKYVDSGFVHDMMDTKSDYYYFIRAHVWPSMRTDLPHNVLCVISVTSGAIIHASCDPCKVSALGRCSHVVAVLFSLLDHVEKHGPTLTVPCTSQECSWNKGKKRDKNPQRLSDASYPTKRIKSEIPIIEFDPRPKANREVKPEHINSFLRNLQEISSSSNGVSMWEVQLQMTYKDYQLDDNNTLILREKTRSLKTNLTPTNVMEFP
jgi:hypothetical protein